MDGTDARWRELAAQLERGELTAEGLPGAVAAAGLADSAASARLRSFLDRFWDLLQARPAAALAESRVALALSELAKVDPTLRAELERRRGAALFASSRFAEARAAGEAGLAWLEGRDPLAEPAVGKTRASLLGLRGNAALAQGDLRSALIALEEAIFLARAHGLRGHLGTHLTSLGNTRLYAGDSRSAEEYYEEALQIAHEEGNRVGVTVGLGNLGVVRQALGDLHGALESYEEALGKAREQGDRRSAATLEANVGEVLIERGDLDGAQRRLESSLVLSRGLSDPALEAAALCNLAAVARERSDLDGALELLGDAGRALERAGGERPGGLRVELGRLWLQRRETQEARAEFLGSLNAALEVHDRRAEATARYELGRLAALEGEPQALKALNQARELAAELDDLGLLAAVELSRAEVLVAQGDSSAAAKALVTATRAEGERPLFAGRLALARAAAMTRSDPQGARRLLHETSTRALRSGYAALAEEARRRLAAL